MLAHLFIPPVSYLIKSLDKFIVSVHLLYKRLRVIRYTIERTCIRQYNVLGTNLNCRQTNKQREMETIRWTDRQMLRHA